MISHRTVSPELSISDHRIIEFFSGLSIDIGEAIGNPSKTDWANYRPL